MFIVKCSHYNKGIFKKSMKKYKEEKPTTEKLLLSMCLMYILPEFFSINQHMYVDIYFPFLKTTACHVCYL